MINKHRELTENQWRFLSLAHFIKEPLSIDVLCHLVPLSPSELVNLISIGRNTGILIEMSGSRLKVSNNLDSDILGRFSEIITPSLFLEVLEIIDTKNLSSDIPVNAILDLYVGCGDTLKAGNLELKMARLHYRNSTLNSAVDSYYRSLQYLSLNLGDRQVDETYLSAVQELHPLVVSLGRNISAIFKHLDKAIDISKRIGDKRSQAIISLKLADLYRAADRREDALRLYKLGSSIADELGDNDITEISNRYLYFYAFIQGHVHQAHKMIYHTARLEEAKIGSAIFNPWPTIFYAYSSAYLGDFNNAIGYLRFVLRRVQRESSHLHSSILKATLGVVLLQVYNANKAYDYLTEALREAADDSNAWATYLAEAGMATFHVQKKCLSEAREWILRMRNTPEQTGIKRQFESPWILEVLYELESSGYELPHDFCFSSMLDKIMEEPKLHLQGVALRLKACELMEKKEAPEMIMAYLDRSERLLKKMCDPIQLAKLYIVKAKLKLHMGFSQDACHLLAKGCSKIPSQIREHIVPKELHTLLSKSIPRKPIKYNSKRFWDSLLSLKKSIKPSFQFEEIAFEVLCTMNQYFSSERAGLFWADPSNQKLRLTSGVNLNSADVVSDHFANCHDQILRTFNLKKPILTRSCSNDIAASVDTPITMLSIPIFIDQTVLGVLYHDSQYIDYAFHGVSQSQLVLISTNISFFLEMILEYSRHINETKLSVQESLIHFPKSDEEEIITFSPAMKRLLVSTEQAAKSEGTVMIFGETGVGKELLARRIHRESHRNSKNFIVIDLTTIPENLIESELFGHEKGAFTNADTQKIGRIELADNGTLFIDELGEIPKSIQVKLLRVIQEKSFTRVGGHKLINTDFRIITATNRDLSKAINEGRFRKDLFYRLNTIPISIPPLRHRKEDILPLANHFLKRFCKKYNKPDTEILPLDAQRLNKYSWPGNVRELRNVIERSVIMSQGNKIEINLFPSLHPPSQNFESRKEAAAPSPVDVQSPASMNDHFLFRLSDPLPSLNELQKRYIEYVLEKTEKKIGGINGAAALIGVNRTTLYAKMRKLKIK